MSEHMMPIPSRLYNAAVGGHVTGADQIIDDETGLTLDKVTGGALEEKEYTSGSDNGMGRVVLRKNIVNGVNTLVQTMINKSNTIYVIQYDFTLGENITVPANCVLEFNGGSISDDGTHTISGTQMIVNETDKQIFDNINIDVLNEYVNVLWFGAKGDNLTDNTIVFNQIFNRYRNIYIPNGTYLTGTINITENFNALSRHIFGDGLYTSPSYPKDRKDITRLVNTGNDYLIKCGTDITFDQVVLERLCLDIPTTCEGGIFVNNIYRSTFRYVYILGNGKTSTKNIGIYVNGCGFCNTFKEITITYVNKGIVFPLSSSTDWMNATTIGRGGQGSVYISMATIGIEIQKGGVFIHGATIEYCETAIKYVDSNTNSGFILSEISDSYFEKDNVVFDIVSLNRNYRQPIIKVYNSEFHANTSILSKTGSPYITFKNNTNLLPIDGVKNELTTQNSAWNMEEGDIGMNIRYMYEDSDINTYKHDYVHVLGVGNKSNWKGQAHESVRSSTVFYSYWPKLYVDGLRQNGGNTTQSLFSIVGGSNVFNNDAIFRFRFIITLCSDFRANNGYRNVESSNAIIFDYYINIRGQINQKVFAIGETYFNSIIDSFNIYFSNGIPQIGLSFVQGESLGYGLSIICDADCYNLLNFHNILKNYGSETLLRERDSTISVADTFYCWESGITQWLYKESGTHVWKKQDGTVAYDFTPV